MEINPFDLMKNFKDIQSKVGEMQEKLKDLVITGSSGGGLVNISLNGQMEVQEVKLDPVVVDNRDIPMLEDLVKAAFTDAFLKVKDKLKDEMNLPGNIAGL